MKYFPLAGVAGPVLFTLTTLVCGALRPDYDHLNQFISELGATGTPNAGIMNAFGFVPSGLLIAVFGISLLRYYSRGVVAVIGSVLILMFGLGMTTAGIFSCDPGCVAQSQEAVIHDGVSAVIFVGVVIGVLLYGISFRRRAEWKPLWIYSVVSGVVLAVLLVVMIGSAETRSLTGLWQRLFLGILFVWLSVTGLRLYNMR